MRSREAQRQEVLSPPAFPPPAMSLGPAGPPPTGGPPPAATCLYPPTPPKLPSSFPPPGHLCFHPCPCRVSPSTCTYWQPRVFPTEATKAQGRHQPGAPWPLGTASPSLLAPSGQFLEGLLLFVHGSDSCYRNSARSMQGRSEARDRPTWPCVTRGWMGGHGRGCLQSAAWWSLGVSAFLPEVQGAHSSFSLCLCLCLSVSLCVSLSVFLYLSMSLCVPLSLSVSVYLFVSLCVSLCLCLSVSPCFSVSLCVFLSLYLCLSLCLSRCIFLSSVSLSPYLSVSLCLCVCFSVSVSISLCVSVSPPTPTEPGHISHCPLVSAALGIAPRALAEEEGMYQSRRHLQQELLTHTAAGWLDPGLRASGGGRDHWHLHSELLLWAGSPGASCADWEARGQLEDGLTGNPASHPIPASVS